jgi:hypothetical protein
MKFSLFACALLASSAAAFNVAVDRRVAFGQIAVGAAAVAGFSQAALADGAVSASTKGRAKGIYGDRIAGLKKAVEAGDFETVAAEKNAFILFNSGSYPSPKDRSKKSEAIKSTNAIFAAIKSGDKAALKSEYSKYVAANKINAMPTVDVKQGQGYSGDADYKKLSKAG